MPNTRLIPSYGTGHSLVDAELEELERLAPHLVDYTVLDPHQTERLDEEVIQLDADIKRMTEQLKDLQLLRARLNGLGDHPLRGQRYAIQEQLRTLRAQCTQYGVELPEALVERAQRFGYEL